MTLEDFLAEPTAKDVAIASATAPNSKRLVSLQSDRVHWIPSRYNARATTPKGVLVLYNSYTGAVSGIPAEHADDVLKLLDQQGFFAGKTLSGMRRDLADRGFVVPQHVDEFQRFRHHYAQTQHRPDVLELILLASEECNFRCTYCYESFPRGTMEPWVRLAVIKLIEKRAPRLNRLNVTYFGGEPLLGLEAISEIGPEALKIADSHGIPYSSSITTNGYLLTPDLFDQLIAWNVQSYQITLDGIESCHDHNRPLKGGGGTYRRILQNLHAIRSTAHDFSVTLRVNFEPSNVPNMPEFLEGLSDFKHDDRFKMRFYPVGKWGGPNDASLDVCGFDSEHVKRSLDSLASELGFNAEGRMPYIAPPSRESVCYAARPYNLIVGADGKLMKCTIVLDTQEYNIIGRMTPEGRADISLDKLLEWTAPYFEDDRTCKKCFFLPVCQGASCPLTRLESAARPCPSEKLQIGPTLVSIWEQGHSKGRQHRVSLTNQHRSSKD